MAVVGLLYVFLAGVKALEAGIGTLGETSGDELFSNVANPIAGLFAGMFATVLVQSSSVTTSTIVGLVGGGVLPLESAIPMVMGANIGTTVTNTLVSIGHIRQGQEFKRAFAGATVHDFFNILTVIVALPLELATGFLSESARVLTGALRGGAPVGAVTGSSPIKEAVAIGVKALESVLADAGAGTGVTGAVLLVVGIVLVFVALGFITSNMKKLMAGRIEQSLNAVLDRGAGVGAMAVGMIITMAVQSSSITTSILVPMVGAGVLSLQNAYPLTLGANVGTTITALLASLASERPEGLTIALVHTLFNVFGILVFYPVPSIRRIPIRLATGLASLAQRSRWWVLAYVGGVFVVLPLVVLAVTR